MARRTTNHQQQRQRKQTALQQYLLTHQVNLSRRLQIFELANESRRRLYSRPFKKEKKREEIQRKNKFAITSNGDGRCWVRHLTAHSTDGPTGKTA